VKAYKKKGKKKVYGKASKKVSATTKASKTAVMTKNGNMKGTYKNGVSSFKGVPFAKPPVGELRKRFGAGEFAVRAALHKLRDEGLVAVTKHVGVTATGKSAPVWKGM
jgi:hypothetical protein